MWARSDLLCKTLARVILAASLCLILCPRLFAQRQSIPGSGVSNSQPDQSASLASDDTESAQAEQEMQRGTVLTRQGRFKDAIPHLLAAQGHITNDYALNFNLALCYVGIGENQKAIAVLEDLRRSHENADVENLLAQAYVGNNQGSKALAAVDRAAAISPKDEKLFAFVADACTQSQAFDLGLKVVDIGLKSLPQSPRLHYLRGTLLADLDQLDEAKADFDLASKTGQRTEIGYLSSAYKNFLEGNMPEAIRIARQSIAQGTENPTLLTILGQALLRSGITPGQPEFTEAQTALEKSISERPNDASSQIALGEIYLLGGRFADAVAHLQTARQMKPNQPAIYANLAKAYRKLGDEQNAQEALSKLEALNEAQAEHIRNAPGERKMSYGGQSSPPQR